MNDDAIPVLWTGGGEFVVTYIANKFILNGNFSDEEISREEAREMWGVDLYCDSDLLTVDGILEMAEGAVMSNLFSSDEMIMKCGLYAQKHFPFNLLYREDTPKHVWAHNFFETSVGVDTMTKISDGLYRYRVGNYYVYSHCKADKGRIPYYYAWIRVEQST